MVGRGQAGRPERARIRGFVHEPAASRSRPTPNRPISDRSAGGCSIWQELGGPARASPRAATHLLSEATASSTEGHAPLAQGDEGIVADDQVIEQLDVEEAAGGQGFGGQVEVVR